jgi:DNA-binding transcriptional ArsR family regulator
MFGNYNHVKKAAQLLKAVGNPHRLQILTQLVDGEKNVGEINAEVNVSQPALSQHLARMRAAGVLTSRRSQRQIYYAIGDTQILRALEIIACITIVSENKKINA